MRPKKRQEAHASPSRRRKGGSIPRPEDKKGLAPLTQRSSEKGKAAEQKGFPSKKKNQAELQKGGSRKLQRTKKPTYP